jgi:hypothetical protein
LVERQFCKLDVAGSIPAAGMFIGKKSPAALFSDISFGAGGKKRGFCRPT